MPDLREQLRSCFQGSVCLMGIGNVDYGDDGFGVCLADLLTRRIQQNQRTSSDILVINAGAVPEQFIGGMVDKRLDHLIFIDAVEFGGTPGSVLFLNAAELASRFPQISTHKISLGLLAQWVEGSGRTKAWLLGVQPGSLQPADGLTPVLKKTLGLLDELICDLWTAHEKIDDCRPYRNEPLVGLRTAEVSV
jgi:hydrogenase maturation protease